MISEFNEKQGTTVIEKTNYGGYEGDYGGRGGSTRARANTALGFGIAGLVAGAAALWNRNGGGIGSILNGGSNGGSMPSNVNVTCGGGATFGLYEKECSDILNLTNQLWSKASAAREIDVAEKFSLWKSQVDADFGLYKEGRDNLDRVNNRLNSELFSLYKYTRDKDDEIHKELCDLRSEVAIARAVRPYQDKLIQCGIDGAFSTLKNYIDSELCLRPRGVAVLPSEPTVTGIASYCCNRTPAAAAGA